MIDYDDRFNNDDFKYEKFSRESSLVFYLNTNKDKIEIISILVIKDRITLIYRNRKIEVKEMI